MSNEKSLDAKKAQHREHDRFERMGQAVGSRNWVRSVKSEYSTTPSHQPEAGWATRLKDIAIKLKTSAIMLGIYLDYLGLREDRRGTTGNIFYAPTQQALDNGIARTGFDGVVGVWIDWHIESVCLAVSTMSDDDKDKAKEMRKTNLKIREEMEEVAKREKEKETKEAVERAAAFRLSRRPIHDRAAELINGGMDRDEVMAMMGIDRTEYDLIKGTHANNHGGCSCGWRNRSNDILERHREIADFLRNGMEEREVMGKLGVNHSEVKAVKNRHVDGVECHICGWAADELPAGDPIGWPRVIQSKTEKENMAEITKIGWAHGTQNFWIGCDKVAPECAHCYIKRTLRQQHRDFGTLWKSTTWKEPAKLQRKAEAEGLCYRMFTCSLSDFFHKDADAWRNEAWEIIRQTPNLVWLILTKRPELAKRRLPADWPDAYPNVWLGVSAGCKLSLPKMNALRGIPIHPKAVRFLSAEPLLEDISDHIDLSGFGWVIVGGESGSGPEYRWNPAENWRKEFHTPGRRKMDVLWAGALLEKARQHGIPYFFKQATAFRPGQGKDSLGRKYEEVPPPPHATWAEKPEEVYNPAT